MGVLQSRHLPVIFPRMEAPLTEKNLPDQTGKVVLITGGYSGIGFELAAILYSKNATIFIAGRSPTSGATAITRIQTLHPNSSGSLTFLALDLADLPTIKDTVQTFLTHSPTLHLLFNNAGVGAHPPNPLTAQGHNIQLGTNCLGPYLLTRLLLPTLRTTALTAPPSTVRIIFASSNLVDIFSPKGGIPPARLRNPGKGYITPYAMSKTGNWFLATRFAAEVRGSGIVSITQHPGMLKSAIWRDVPWLLQAVVERCFLHDAIWGAYTMLWTGFAAEITEADGGRFAVPWGKWHPHTREDIELAMVPVGEGGTGEYGAFNEWCDEMVGSYV